MTYFTHSGVYPRSSCIPLSLTDDPGSCSSRQGGLKLKGSGHSPAQVPMGQALCQALGRKGEGSSGHLPAEKGGAAGARASSLPGGQGPGGGLSL